MPPEPYPPAIARLLRDGGGLFMDFDGTLAEIVADPAEARLAPGMDLRLVRLGRCIPVVVVSGRTARELQHLVPPGIELFGTHGAERVVAGQVVPLGDQETLALSLRPLVPALRRELARSGVVVEDKGVSIALHYRTATDHDLAQFRIQRALQRTPIPPRFVTRPGRMLVEIVPGAMHTKADAVRTILRERSLRNAVFIGDDMTDLDGFAAIRVLGPGHACAIAVSSPEAPPALLHAADVAVAGVTGVAALLDALITELGV